MQLCMPYELIIIIIWIQKLSYHLGWGLGIEMDAKLLKIDDQTLNSISE